MPTVLKYYIKLINFKAIIKYIQIFSYLKVLTKKKITKIILKPMFIMARTDKDIKF